MMPMPGSSPSARQATVVHAHGHTVVTHERPAPNAVKKIKIPDVCGGLSVPYINTPTMLRRERARFVLG